MWGLPMLKKSWLPTIFCLLVLLVRARQLNLMVNLNLGNLYYLQSHYADDKTAKFQNSRRAITHYQWGLNETFPRQRLFRVYEINWSSASALYRSSDALDAFRKGYLLVNDSNLPFNNLCSSSLGLIEAEHFSGLSPSTIRVVKQIDERQVAYLFSSPPISYTLCFPETGLYRIDIVAQERQPAPIEIAVYCNDWLIDTVKLDKGDNSWSHYSLYLTVPSGKYVLSLSFMNDSYDSVSNIDRNAAIDYIEVSLKQRIGR